MTNNFSRKITLKNEPNYNAPINLSPLQSLVVKYRLPQEYKVYQKIKSWGSVLPKPVFARVCALFDQFIMDHKGQAPDTVTQFRKYIALHKGV